MKPIRLSLIGRSWTFNGPRKRFSTEGIEFAGTFHWKGTGLLPITPATATAVTKCRSYYTCGQDWNSHEGRGTPSCANAAPSRALSLAFEELSPSGNCGAPGHLGPVEPSIPEPCILLHGMLGCRRNLRTLGKLLPFRRCILVDLRNHGDSPHSLDCSFEAMTRDIHHLVTDTIGATKVHIIGHSLGGRVAMATALTYPHLVCGLGVLDMAPPRILNESSVTSSSQQHASRADLLRILKLINNTPLHKFSTRTELAKWLVDNYNGQKPLSQGTLEFLTQNVRIQDGELSWIPNVPALLASFDNQLLEWPFIPEVHQWTNGPVLFIRGKRSGWVEAKDFSTIRGFFPEAAIRDVDAGHWVHSDTPNAVAQEIHTCWNEKVTAK